MPKSTKKTKLPKNEAPASRLRVAINACFGGFALSPKAILRYAELKGKKCYFFLNINKTFQPCTLNEAEKTFFYQAFDIPDPNTATMHPYEDWQNAPHKTKKKWNKEYEQHLVWKDTRHQSRTRTEPELIQAIDELQKDANGHYSNLKIIEIPINIEWEIEEYDGFESVVEKHRSWS